MKIEEPSYSETHLAVRISFPSKNLHRIEEIFGNLGNYHPFLLLLDTGTTIDTRSSRILSGWGRRWGPRA
jgi:hypothetical protein